MHGTGGGARHSSGDVQSFQPEELGGEILFDVRSLLSVVRRHIWLVLATVVGVSVVAILITFQLQQQFTATALVVVDARDSQVVRIDPAMTDGVNATNLVDTEVEIARSSRVIERAASALDVASRPNFADSPSFLDLLRSLVGMSPRQENTVNSTAFTELSSVDRARLVQALSKLIRVKRVGVTNVISMSATADKPDVAASTANMLAQAYLLEQMAAKLESNERGAAVLRTRVDSLAKDINALEDKLDTFITDKLAQLGSADVQKLLQTIKTEANMRNSNARTLADLQSAMRGDDNDRLAQLLAAQESDLAAKRASIAAQIANTQDQISLAEARQRLNALDADIRNAATRQITDLQTKISLSDAHTVEARSQIDAMLTQLDLPKEVSVELFRLQQDVETSRNLYQSYLTKLRQVEQQTDFSVPDSRVIADAMPPENASFPPRRLILAGSFLLSLGLGLGLAFLRENFVGGATSVEHLENLTGVPVLAAVPWYAGSRGGHPDAAIFAEPLSQYSEAIRRVRLGLEAYSPKAKVIYVTSALPGDGKTTMAISLARVIASTGKKVLLIDADLRHPSVHRTLGERPTRGLSDFLTDITNSAPETLSLINEKETGVSFVLGAEASLIATDVLLMSQRFQDLLAFARAEYDTIIIDTPPVGLVVDASIVARYCDAGLFVVRYASTGQHALRAALRDLRARSDTGVLGVLNGVAKADTYRYGSRGQYRKYYG